MTEAVNFLRMSREQLALQGMRVDPPRGATKGKGSRTLRAPDVGAARQIVEANAAPSSLLTTFASPVNNGYVLVKANGESIVYENLWEERKSGLLRRKIPRTVSVAKPVKSGAVDIEVWVVVPSLNIEEHRQLQDTFAPGVQRRLTVTLDKSKKKIVVTLS